jgi:predicted DNA-binding transcriptional regulator YafY
MEKEVKFIVTGKKKEGSKDKRLSRLIGLLSMLANDERFVLNDLQEEFGVSVRMLQKDIEQLKVFFPLEKDEMGRYKLIDGVHIHKAYLHPDEMMLVSLALSQFKDISDFDQLTQSTLKKLLQPQTFNPYFVKYDDMQDIDIDSSLIEELELAIKEQKHIVIMSSRGDIEVEPYKIANYDGIWYLVAKDEADQRTKTFMLSRIQKIEILHNKHRVSQQKVQELLDKTHSAWFEEGNCFEVKVKVYSKIAYFFKEKDFLQSQEILEELDDGSLIVSFEISHYEDIDNIIKAWLPDIEVLEPIEYKNKIKNELQEYIKRIS